MIDALHATDEDSVELLHYLLENLGRLREVQAYELTYSINFQGGAWTDTPPHIRLTENDRRGVAKEALHGELFHATANLKFGELAPYTGHQNIK